MKLLSGLGVAFVSVVGLFGYLTVVDLATRRIRARRRNAIVAVAWSVPALLLMGSMLLYPLVATVWWSFKDADSAAYVGLANYRYIFTNPDVRTAFRNSMFWLVGFTTLVVTIGLVVATLTDRVRYERIAKAVIVMPMAISFVGAGVIWGFMYDFRPPGTTQTGTLNGALGALGRDPVPWLAQRNTVNPALIAIGVWMFVGFAAVLLSAAIKGVPTEIIEAARVDGATEIQTFVRIILPTILPNIAVVGTLMAITALKAFDIVYVLTNGNFGSEVIATAMYKQLFSARNLGRASALAVALLGATLPIILVNTRIFKRQAAA